MDSSDLKQTKSDMKTTKMEFSERKILNLLKNKSKRHETYECILNNYTEKNKISLFTDFYIEDANNDDLLALNLLIKSILKEKFCFDGFSDLFLSIFKRQFCKDMAFLTVECIINNVFTYTDIDNLVQIILNNILSHSSEHTFYYLLVLGSIINYDSIFLRKNSEIVNILIILEHSIESIAILARNIKSKEPFLPFQQFYL